MISRARHYRITADDKTFDRVMDKAIELGCSIREGKVVQADDQQREAAFLLYLDHCGIEAEPIEFEERKIPKAERIAYSLRIATLGRKAFGIC